MKVAILGFGSLGSISPKEVNAGGYGIDIVVVYNRSELSEDAKQLLGGKKTAVVHDMERILDLR